MLSKESFKIHNEIIKNVCVVKPKPKAREEILLCKRLSLYFFAGTAFGAGAPL